jgi:hypothetical protein
MGMKVGLWIDHRKAVLVRITEKGEEIEVLPSEVEKQLRRKGESPLKGPFDVLHVPADTIRQRAFTGYLNAYYDAVIAKIQAADAVMIIGPGEAKEELRKRMEKNHLGQAIACVEGAGRMTTRQIAAKVRLYFLEVA